MTPASTLAVVVVSYNVRDLLAACLSATFASLAASPELDATVHVVDNASRDGSAEMVAREFPSVRLTASADNLGFAGGNNLILRELGFGRPGCAAPDAALLLNPDAEPLDDAIGQMAAFLRARGRCGRGRRAAAVPRRLLPTWRVRISRTRAVVA